MKTRALTSIVLLALAAAVPLAPSACSSDESSTPSPDAGSGDVTTAPDTSVADTGAADAGADTAADAPDPCAPGDGGYFPDDLYCTGLYDKTTKQIAANVKPYTPGLLFWSDGAEKSRWLYLPPGTQIDTTDMDEWVFPVGTKVWKEFRLAGGKKVETRLWQKFAPSFWQPTVYLWSEDQTSATRWETGKIIDGGAIDGGPYEIPSTDLCSQCHQGHTDDMLGIEAFGLGLSTASGVTLTSLKNDGLLTSPPATTTTTVPEDSSGKAAAALGWLHVNCGVACHTPNTHGTAHFTGLYMRLGTHGDDGGAPPSTPQETDTYLTAVGVTATAVSGHPQTVRIVKNDAASSLVPALDGVRGPGTGQMPPIVTTTVDSNGVQAVIDWINAMP